MEKRRVVITGMGAVTPLGLTVEESWLAVRAGTCGIAPITLYDTSGMKAKLAGEVKGFEPADYMEKREARKMDRFAQLINCRLLFHPRQLLSEIRFIIFIQRGGRLIREYVPRRQAE